MITLTTEQAQQIEEALVNLCNSIQLPTSDVKALSTIRAARAQEQAEQEPVALPNFPEAISLSDLDYAQHEKPDGWDDGHFKTWQDLQVCQRNKTALFKYAKQLRELLLNSQHLSQKPVGCFYGVADHIGNVVRLDIEIPIGTKLYAAPARTKELTADEIEEFYTRIWSGGKKSMFAFARAVIAADREKNK